MKRVVDAPINLQPIARREKQLAKTTILERECNESRRSWSKHLQLARALHRLSVHRACRVASKAEANLPIHLNTPLVWQPKLFKSSDGSDKPRWITFRKRPTPSETQGYVCTEAAQTEQGFYVLRNGTLGSQHAYKTVDSQTLQTSAMQPKAWQMTNTHIYVYIEGGLVPLS